MDGNRIPPWRVTSADLAIRELAASEARLLERHVDDMRDLESYRLLAHTGIHELHRSTMDLRRATATIERQGQEIRRQRAEIEALREELRRYTAQAVKGRAA